MAPYWVYLSSEVSANRVVIALSRIVVCDDARPALLSLPPDVGQGDGAPVLRHARVPGQGARPVAGPAWPGPRGPPVMLSHTRLLAVVRALG